jgi:hypothetical protein
MVTTCSYIEEIRASSCTVIELETLPTLSMVTTPEGHEGIELTAGPGAYNSDLSNRIIDSKDKPTDRNQSS